MRVSVQLQEFKCHHDEPNIQGLTHPACFLDFKTGTGGGKDVFIGLQLHSTVALVVQPSFQQQLKSFLE